MHELMEAHNRANDPKRQEAADRERRKVQITPDNLDAFTARLPARP